MNTQGAMCSQFLQDVRALDLGTAPPAGGLVIQAREFNSYIAVLPDGAAVTIKLGSAQADGYDLRSVPVRRSGQAYGEVVLSWAVQAGVTGTFILGRDEQAGVR